MKHGICLLIMLYCVLVCGDRCLVRSEVVVWLVGELYSHVCRTNLRRYVSDTGGGLSTPPLQVQWQWSSAMHRLAYVIVSTRTFATQAGGTTNV